VAFVSIGFAQQAATPGTSQQRVVGQPQGQPLGGGFGLAPAAKPKATKLQEASEQLKQADGVDARKEAQAKLSSVVNSIFDEDLKRRESEVDDIRDRVSKLKALIDKRKESEDRIVDLQFRIQVNEAAGLGFPVKQKSRSRTPNAGTPGSSGMGPPGYFRGFSYAGGGSPGATGYANMAGSDKPVDKTERTLRAVMAQPKKARIAKPRSRNSSRHWNRTSLLTSKFASRRSWEFGRESRTSTNRSSEGEVPGTKSSRFSWKS